jgi:hypothetical protein
VVRLIWLLLTTVADAKGRGVDLLIGSDKS